MARKRKSKRRSLPSAKNELPKKVGGILLGSFALAILAFGAWQFQSQKNLKRANQLDDNTLCPQSGPKALTVIIVDTTDHLPTPARIQIQRILREEWLGTQKQKLLEIRVIKPDQSGNDRIFHKCNPGDGSGSNPWISNPEKIRKEWKRHFAAPLKNALNSATQQGEANSSPIMEALQRVSVELLEEYRSNSINKSLIVISDMLQHSPNYSHYRDDMSFQRFKQSIAYKDLKTDLQGTSVTIYYVQRLTKKRINSGQHIKFWIDWIADNNGRLEAAKKLQGIN